MGFQQEELFSCESRELVSRICGTQQKNVLSADKAATLL